LAHRVVGGTITFTAVVERKGARSQPPPEFNDEFAPRRSRNHPLHLSQEYRAPRRIPVAFKPAVAPSSGGQRDYCGDNGSA